jgi:hypothetical protein
VYISAQSVLYSDDGERHFKVQFGVMYSCLIYRTKTGIAWSLYRLGSICTSGFQTPISLCCFDGFSWRMCDIVVGIIFWIRFLFGLGHIALYWLPHVSGGLKSSAV